MRFLIVDDDESIHLYLKSILAPFGEIDCVSSGEAGYERFDQALADGASYDVVLMDILMPGMDGHQTAETMRAREKELGVTDGDRFKLVMITALVDDTNVSRAFFGTDALCYIVKPLEKGKVIEELKRNFIIQTD